MFTLKLFCCSCFSIRELREPNKAPAAPPERLARCWCLWTQSRAVTLDLDTTVASVLGDGFGLQTLGTREAVGLDARPEGQEASALDHPIRVGAGQHARVAELAVRDAGLVLAILLLRSRGRVTRCHSRDAITSPG